MSRRPNKIIQEALGIQPEPDPMADRVPVQASSGRGKKPGAVAGTVSWEEHDRAHRSYARRYGTKLTARQVADRGGFDWYELVDYLSMEPLTWRPANRRVEVPK